MDILLNQFTLLTVSLMGLLVVFLTYSIKAIYKHGTIVYLSWLGRTGKSVAGALAKLITGLIGFLSEANADTSDEILDKQDDQSMQDIGIIGEYNFRTHKLDAGTDPDGWYEEDM